MALRDYLIAMGYLSAFVELPLLLLGTALYHRRRNAFPIRGRHPHLVVFHNLCLVPLLAIWAVALISENDTCVLGWGLTCVFMPIVFLTVIFRAWSLLFQFELTTDVRQFELLASQGSQRAEQAALLQWKPGWFTRHRSWMLPQRFYRLAAVAVLSSLALYLGTFPYGNPSVTCDLVPTEAKVVGYFMGFQLGVESIWFIAISHRLRKHDKDGFGTKREFDLLAVCTALAVTCFLVGFPAFVSTPQADFYAFSCLVLATALYMLCMTWMPVLFSYRFERILNEKLATAQRVTGLAEFLKLEGGFDCFLAFCTREFSSESLYFWHRVQDFRVGKIPAAAAGGALVGGTTAATTTVAAATTTAAAGPSVVIGIPPSPQSSAATRSVQETPEAKTRALVASLGAPPALLRPASSSKADTAGGASAAAAAGTGTGTVKGRPDASPGGGGGRPLAGPGHSRSQTRTPRDGLRRIMIDQRLTVQDCLEAALQIYTTYLAEGAHFEVNISGSLRKAVTENLKRLQSLVRTSPTQGPAADSTDAPAAGPRGVMEALSPAPPVPTRELKAARASFGSPPPQPQQPGDPAALQAPSTVAGSALTRSPTRGSNSLHSLRAGQSTAQGETPAKAKRTSTVTDILNRGRDNILASARDVLLDELLHVFDDAQAAVLLLMEANSWPRFRTSKAFQTFLDEMRGWLPGHVQKPGRVGEGSVLTNHVKTGFGAGDPSVRAESLLVAAVEHSRSAQPAGAAVTIAGSG